MCSLAMAMWNGYRVHKLLPFNVIVTDSHVKTEGQLIITKIINSVFHPTIFTRAT
jgi:hypothetical protein